MAARMAVCATARDPEHRMMMMRALRALAVLAATLCAAAPAGAGDVLDRVMAKKVMVLASDAAYPPQSFINDNNEMVGFDVDVAKEIARRLGVALEIVTPPWTAIIAGRWDGAWDISVGSMTPTPERAKELDFPAIYYYTPAGFAVHENSRVHSIDALNGKIIGVCGGCTYEFYLEKLLVINAEGTPPFRFRVDPGALRRYETDVNAFDDLKLGDGERLDAVLSAMPTIRRAIETGYPIRIVGDPVFYEPLAVAVDQGDPEWSAKLARIVQAMHRDGTLSRLSETWYGVDYSRAE